MMNLNYLQKTKLKNKIESYDEKWLEESRAKLTKQIDDRKRANLIMARMITLNKWLLYLLKV